MALCLTAWTQADSPSVSTLYYWDVTDGKANGTEIKPLSLGLHLTASPFIALWLAAKGKKLNNLKL